MNYAEIKYYDISNGLGVRTSLFVSGCNHHCKGCFNEIAWDFNYGNKFTDKTMDDILKSLEPKYIAGLSILGGEPLDPDNIITVAQIIIKVKQKYPNKSIWVYTGYNFDDIYDLVDNASKYYLFPRHYGKSYTYYKYIALGLIDVLVDGKFEEDKKDITLKFRGSSNQRLIDIKKTLENKKIVLYNLN